MARKPTIPQVTRDEVDPTPECLVLSETMVQQYAQRYSRDWVPEMQVCEEVVEKEIADDVVMIAKLDRYFHTPKQIVFESGVEGFPVVLSPGWWVEEYKTSGLPRQSMQRRWVNDMQGDFQSHVLEEKVGEKAQGVIVNVLETPRVYTPVRTCKECRRKLEFAAYKPTAGGYECPMCGFEQKLKPVERKPIDMQCYRLVARRSHERLEESRRWIESVAREMMEYREMERGTWAPIPRECEGRYGACEYFEPHSAMRDASEVGGFVEIDATAYLRR